MTTIKFRRDTSANWTSVNPIPAQGEPCYETDTGKLKIGNGSDTYTTLPYVSDGGGSSGDLPIATSTTLGGIKVGNNLSITEDGTLSANAGTTGTTDYTQLENKPQINSVELTGNKTLDDLGIQPKGNYQPAGDYATTADIPTKTSELTNDSGFLTEAPIPTNMVTTDTAQTISGSKTFSAQSNFNNGCNFNSSSYSANYFKKGFQIGNVYIYNTSGNTIRIEGSSTHFLTFNDNNIKFMSSSSTPGMNITDGTITTAYNKPYLKIKEHNDNTNTHNLEISCDTTNNNSWNIACGDQTFINTTNIDTTYMKWDSTSKKLKVDTAAVAHLAMPSNTKVSLTLGASGTTYTAPSDGLFSFVSGSTTEAGQYCRLINTNAANFRQSAYSSGSGQYIEVLLPIAKEQSVSVHYTTPVDTFRFVYAVGAVPTNT